jgi:RNA polymerase sigma-70 factor (ECF subfamily)
VSAEELQLLLRAHRGHEPSARALWNHHAPRLLVFAASILGARADAEDAVQAVFCRILELPARRIREVSDPAAWLVQLTRNAALNHLRAARRERARRTARGAGPANSSAPRAPDAIGDAELDAALARLPRRYREAVVLRHVAGLTFDQIAESLGQNRSTIASRYRAAIEALRRSLGIEPSSNASSNGSSHFSSASSPQRVHAELSEPEVPHVC